MNAQESSIRTQFTSSKQVQVQVNKEATSPTAHLANNEKILPLDHAILDHGMDALSHLRLVLVDKRSINVPVTRWDGRFHRRCDLAGGRLTHTRMVNYCGVQMF